MLCYVDGLQNYGLSGHKDGSRAFARYREIDDDLKKELISILD